MLRVFVKNNKIPINLHIINIKNEKTLMRPTSYEKLEKPKIRPTLSFVNYENQEHLFVLKK